MLIVVVTSSAILVFLTPRQTDNDVITSMTVTSPLAFFMILSIKKLPHRIRVTCSHVTSEHRDKQSKSKPLKHFINKIQTHKTDRKRGLVVLLLCKKGGGAEMQGESNQTGLAVLARTRGSTRNMVDHTGKESIITFNSLLTLLTPPFLATTTSSRRHRQKERKREREKQTHTHTQRIYTPLPPY